VPKTKRVRQVDPSTGKEIRAPRVVLTEDQKAAVLAERIKLGRMLSDESLPDTVVKDAARILNMGSTQLLRRLQKVNS
jgi:hypothetical protein